MTWMHVSTARPIRRIACLVMAAAVSITGSVVAPAAFASTPLDECVTESTGDETWGCYDIEAVGSGDPSARVNLSWKLHTDAEGYDNDSWRGGVVLTGWPVEGQWKKYPTLEATLIPGPDANCEGNLINAGNCYQVFSGPSGTTSIEFTPGMAGFVYEVYSHDQVCATVGDCSPSGASVDQYVYVLKAFQYTNKKGKVVKAAKCPPRKKRKSACVPAATAQVVDSISAAVPVPLP